MNSAQTREAGALFETLLLERIFAPMKVAFGEFGGIAVEACARSVAERDGNGFAGLIAGYLESHD